ncbi:MAG: hypothetical protein DHS20C05_14190 [Hyphococcus sp.]|nr:MAG: hypothetical protein DHS20C05_14190 [Marinicaulis sp.]
MARRYLFSVLAVWVFIFAFETLVHGLGLSGMYAAENTLFRAPEDGVALMPVLIIGHFALAVGIVGLVCGFARAGTISRAAQIGAFLGLTIGGGSALLTYVAQPLPVNLVMAWCVAGVIEFAAAAALARIVFGDRFQS